MCAGQTKWQLRSLNSQPNKWKEIAAFTNKNFIESIEAPVIRKFQQQCYDTVLPPKTLLEIFPCKAKIIFRRIAEHFPLFQSTDDFSPQIGTPVIKKRAIGDVWVFQISLTLLAWVGLRNNPYHKIDPFETILRLW